jgi:hypothetical protein
MPTAKPPNNSDRKILTTLILTMCLVVTGTIVAGLASGIISWQPIAGSLLSSGKIGHHKIHVRNGGSAGRSSSRSTGSSGTNPGNSPAGNSTNSKPAPSKPAPPSSQPNNRPPAVSPPASLAADCSRDVTAELQSFFASVPDGSLVRLKAQGCYLVSQLGVRGHANLTVDGNGATIKAGVFLPNPVTGWRDELNLTVRDLTIVGADPTPGVYKAPYHANAGIALGHVINGKILNVTVRNVAGDFVYVGPTHPRAGPDFFPSRNVSIIGLHGFNAGRDGISFAYCETGLLAHSTLTNTGRSAIDMVDINYIWRADDITIENNTFTHPGTGFLVMGGHGNNLVVRNNSVHGHNLWAKDKGPPGDPNDGFVFVNNVSDSQTHSPFVILLYRVSGVVISGNSQPFPPPPNGGRVWVEICDTSHVQVVDNHVAYAIPVRQQPGCTNTDWSEQNNR